MTRSGGGGGTASATAAVGNDVPRASRSAASSSQGWTFDVQCCRAGGYESRCWTTRLEGGAGDAKCRRRYGGRRMDGILPRRRRDGDGCGDAAVSSDRQRRRLRRGRGTTRRDATRREGEGATTRDESGRWTMQGGRVESGAFPYLICVCESQSQICDL